MALEVVAEREGGWDAIKSFLGQDAKLLQEGETYRTVFYLKPYPSWQRAFYAGEVKAVEFALRLKGAEDVTATLNGNQVILEYRVGFNPMLVLSLAMAVAIFLVLLIIGYTVFKVVRAVGLPPWIAIGAAALAVLWASTRLRRMLA